MTPIDISPANLEIVRFILREQIPEIEVRAFGSRVAWTAQETSDLDLALITTEPLSAKRMSDLREAFTESRLPFRVDVVDWADTSENFRKIIKNENVIIQKKTKNNLVAKNGWKNMPFGEAVLVNPAVALKRGKIYPFVNMAAVNPNSRFAYAVERRKYSGSGSHFQAGDTLMARITPCLENGKIARYHATCDEETAHGSTEFIIIRGRSDVTDTEFAYYLTRWKKIRSHAVSQMTGTSGRQRVPVKSLYHLMIPVPPLHEQRLISHVLGALDNKIELNRRTSETLKAIARALFKSWFVDFDPVRAKMEGRWRRGKSLPGLPEHLYDVFPNRLVNSELSQIPDGWQVKTLSDIAVMIKGRSYRSIDFADSDTALATLKSFDRGGSYRSEGFKPYTGPYKPEQLIEPGEVIVACTDITQKAEVIGRPLMVRPDPRYARFVASLHSIIVRPSNKQISNELLYLLCGTPAFINHTYSQTTGTTVLGLSKKAISSFQFVLPSSEITLAFGKIAKDIFSRIFSLEKESYMLTELRNALLPKLISGELSVRNMVNLRYNI